MLLAWGCEDVGWGCATAGWSVSEDVAQDPNRFGDPATPDPRGTRWDHRNEAWRIPVGSSVPSVVANHGP